jgi:hypothetical protein
MYSQCWKHALIALAVAIISLNTTTASGQPGNPLRDSVAPRGGVNVGPTLVDPSGGLRGEIVDFSEVRRAGFSAPVFAGQTTPLQSVMPPSLTQPIYQEGPVSEEVEVLPVGDPPKTDTALPAGTIISGQTIFGEDCADCGGLTTRLGICADGCLIPCPQVQWEKFQFFSGVAGFTGPANRGGHSSFGFTEGFNWGTGFPRHPRLSGQIGYRAIQSTFSGTDFTDIDRKQSFVTAAVFRRADWGWQGGLAMDYLHDDWYFDIDVIQLRAELSWKFPQGDEIGFWLTKKSDGATSDSRLGKPASSTFSESWDLTDAYVFYFRRQVQPGGEFRMAGGFTEDKDGLLSADARLPINERLALDINFTYLIPHQGSMTTGHEEEGWNVGINFVFFPGCNTPYNIDYNRPLFSVADNGTMFLSRRQ